MFRTQLLRTSRTATQSIKQTSRIQRISSSQFPSPSRLARLSHPTVSQHIPRRWQSTESVKTEETADGDAAAAQEISPETTLKQELEKKNKEIIDLKDKYLRSVADYRNLQDRTSRDKESARNFAIQKFATDLLDSIDNLDRALSSVPDAALSKDSADTNKDLVNLHSGLRMTESILMQTLAKHGVVRFDPLEREGRKFDPNMDEATFFAPREGAADGEVFYTQSKGYTLNGRVVRASKVGVVKNP